MSVDHSGFAPILDSLSGPGALGRVDVPALDAYVESLSNVRPDDLGRDEALAYWINLYNARAIRLAVDARAEGSGSVLRIPGAFDTRDVVIDGEALSLNDVEHGKIRRFGDPRIHGALVCGSLSCPTLRRRPFDGVSVDAALDEQLRNFLSAGGAQADRSTTTLYLSRVFLWYGADFVRPGRMPTVLPARRRDVAEAASRWMSDELRNWTAATKPAVSFQPYDWGLGCTVS